MIYDLLGGGGRCGLWLAKPITANYLENARAWFAFLFDFFVLPSPPRGKLQVMIVSMRRLMGFGIPKTIQHRSKIKNEISLDSNGNIMFSTSFLERYLINCWVKHEDTLEELLCLSWHRFAESGVFKNTVKNMNIKIVMYHMQHRASSFLLTHYKNCIWRWASLWRLMLNSFGHKQKQFKNDTTSVNKWFDNAVNNKWFWHRLLINFWLLLDAFWLRKTDTNWYRGRKVLATHWLDPPRSML